MYQLRFNPQVNQLLADFYEMTGIQVGIHSKNQDILIEWPITSTIYREMAFCDKVRSCSKTFLSRCAACDNEAFARVISTRQTYIYHCHMGFLEALIPIFEGDKMICSLFIGRVRDIDHGNSLTHNALMSLLTGYGVPEEHLDDQCKAYYALIAESKSRFTASVRVLEMCVQNIYDNRWIYRVDRDIIDAFKTYVQRHLLDPITIGSVAHEIGISTSHLSKKIRTELNTTFTDYIQEQRMKVACSLLTETDLTIAEIASKLCFNDPGYFMSVFKKKTGFTCMEYRKRPFKNCSSFS